MAKAKRTDGKKEGFACPCGIFNRFPLYVFAHWRDHLRFTCDCGRKYSIICGHANLSEPQGKGE